MRQTAHPLPLPLPRHTPPPPLQLTVRTDWTALLGVTDGVHTRREEAIHYGADGLTMVAMTGTARVRLEGSLRVPLPLVHAAGHGGQHGKRGTVHTDHSNGQGEQRGCYAHGAERFCCLRRGSGERVQDQMGS